MGIVLNRFVRRGGKWKRRGARVLLTKENEDMYVSHGNTGLGVFSPGAWAAWISGGFEGETV